MNRQELVETVARQAEGSAAPAEDRRGAIGDGALAAVATAFQQAVAGR